MTFTESISACLKKYTEFKGRASRSEYWYWFLFTFLLNICVSILDLVIFPFDEWGPLGTIISIAVFLPSIAVGARRLHDIGKSGWWQLLWCLPIIGWIVLVIWLVRVGQPDENAFGANPLAGTMGETPATQTL